MLGSASFIGFIPVRDLDIAQEFYIAKLGLAMLEQSAELVTLDAGGTVLRLTPVAAFSAQPFTIAGWRVLDIAETVERFTGQGIKMLDHPELEQDTQSVWTAPGGNRVAWFGDPDHNILSLTQFAGAVVDEFWV